MNDTKKQAAALTAKYGAEALDHLREAETMLQLVAALGTLESLPWKGQAAEWHRAVQSVTAQIEDTDLSGQEPVDYKALPTREAIACAARENLTVYLMVRRKDGTREEVEYEPYAIRQRRDGGEYLYCWHEDHSHVECLDLDRVLYLTGTGAHFTPRFEVEF